MGSTNFDLWLAVSEYRIADALSILSPETSIVNRPWWKIWAKPAAPANLDPVREVAFTLLSNPTDTTLLIPEMPLKAADKIFPEWIRFCCSVHYSRHFPEQLEFLLKQTVRKLEELAEEVRKKSNGYPNNSISGDVWFNGAVVRNWSEALGYLFEMRQKPQEKAAVL